MSTYYLCLSLPASTQGGCLALSGSDGRSERSQFSPSRKIKHASYKAFLRKQIGTSTGWVLAGFERLECFNTSEFWFTCIERDSIACTTSLASVPEDAHKGEKRNYRLLHVKTFAGHPQSQKRPATRSRHHDALPGYPKA